MKFIETEDLNNMLDQGRDVYRHFLGEMPGKKKILSPLRKEDDPSFSLYINRQKGIYYWKDQGSGKFGNHWDFIMEKTGLNFTESINYAKQNILFLGNHGIDNDRVNLASIKLSSTTRIKEEQVKSVIIPIFREWSKKDRNYFMETIKMTPEDMELAWYRPVKNADIITKDKHYKIYESESNPIYAICFPSGNYKLYRPFGNKRGKWISNVEKETDFYLLPDCRGGDALILLGGNRDTASFRKHLKLDTMALLSESAGLPEDLYYKLNVMYSGNIFSLYDNDKAGVKGAEKLEREYGIQSLSEAYRKFKVNDFCNMLEEKFELLEEFSLFLYSKI